MRNYRLFFGLLLCLFAAKICSVQAQPKMLEYSSDYERQVISLQSHSNQADLLDLLCISDPLSTPETSKEMKRVIAELARSLSPQVEAQTTEAKKLAVVYDAVKRKYLKTFKDLSTFPQLFRDGTYSSTTATAFYVLLFECLHIPYQVKREPSHVYVMAYPFTSNSLVPTVPSNLSYNAPSEEYKKAIVQHLVEEKYVAKETAEADGIEKTFNNFYYNHDKISLTEVASLVYFDKFREQWDSKQHKKAYYAIEKAILIYPSPDYEYWKEGALRALCDQMDFSKLEHFQLLAELVNIGPNEQLKRYTSAMYYNFLSKYLSRNGQLVMVDTISRQFIPSLSDAELRDEQYESYFGLLADFHVNMGNYEKALAASDSLYHYVPKNVQAQTLIAKLLLQAVGTQVSEQSFSKLQLGTTKYPFLMENNLFRAYYITYLGSISAQNFYYDNYTAGNKYFVLLEKEMKKGVSDLAIEEDKVVKAYGEKCAYQCRKKQLPLAKQTVLQGLKYFPSDAELKFKKQTVEAEMKRQGVK